ncbi:hypothetical protein [Bacillus sp. NPDC094106]|uniref:hypothetical protein n=1 Tax=Bacillus sp. NPDC094106 TaxID=3363949 RepID=UPI00381341E6
MSKMQIGWYVLTEDKVFKNNSYECAAWYQEIKVPKGKYPIYSSGFVYNHAQGFLTNKIEDNSIGCKLIGTVISSDFSSHFAGNQVSSKINEDVGQEGSIYFSPYAHSLAESILKGNSTCELLPDFEAKEIHFMSNGKEYTTHGIFKKD